MAESDDNPTDEGKRRHPWGDDSPGYWEGIPCTCREDCPDPCDGRCGCRACPAYNADMDHWARFPHY